MFLLHEGDGIPLSWDLRGVLVSLAALVSSCTVSYTSPSARSAASSAARRTATRRCFSRAYRLPFLLLEGKPFTYTFSHFLCNAATRWQ